mmetsp:Transcript_25775/g.34201  ORF Transcript_25775/g.34201 Transcript_25775/m.34201 type:complete len:80 (-) Transcript_25775:330-569(-)
MEIHTSKHTHPSLPSAHKAWNNPRMKKEKAKQYNSPPYPKNQTYSTQTTRNHPYEDPNSFNRRLKPITTMTIHSIPSPP